MKLTVLSIDDSKTIKTHLNFLLNELDRVEWLGHAFSIEEGIKLVQKKCPDVILLDIMLNEENGFDLLNYVKLHHPKIKVFIISNLSGTIYKEKSKQMGACHFIDKSFEFEKISLFFLNIRNHQ